MFKSSKTYFSKFFSSQVKTFTWILLEQKYILELETQIESQVKLNFKSILLTKFLVTLLTWQHVWMLVTKLRTRNPVLSDLLDDQASEVGCGPIVA